METIPGMMGRSVGPVAGHLGLLPALPHDLRHWTSNFLYLGLSFQGVQWEGKVRALLGWQKGPE
jgi:hypothetical protein